MKPDWDKLGSKYADSSVVIADADCTKEQALCSDYGVQGYPTIKYFTAETGKDGAAYNSGRDYDSLEKFVEETLSKSCDVDDTENCDEKEVKFIAKMKGTFDEGVKMKRKEELNKSVKNRELKQKKKMIQKLLLLRQ